MSIDVVKIIFKEFNKSKRDSGTMSIYEKNFFNSLTPTQQLQYKNCLLEKEVQVRNEQIELISFVLDFITNVNGNERKDKMIYFD